MPGPVRVGAVVLAAGASSRMGANKLLLPLGGEPLVRRSTRTALEAGLDPVLVVLGHQADAVRAALAGLACDTLVNPDHAAGARASLQAGLRALPEGVSAAVVLLADMPCVTTSMVAAVASHHRERGARLVVCRYGGVEAPPTLFGRPLFAELMEAGGEGVGRHVVLRHRDEARVVECPQDALADVDDAADYDRLTRLFTG